MTFKGYCFFAGDYPNENYPHYIAIISQTSAEGKVLVVPFSSIKFIPSSKYKYKNQFCKYYDDACTFDGTEIIDDKGKHMLKKPSFIRYEWASEVLMTDIFNKIIAKKIYAYKCKLTDDNLAKIQNGAKKSLEIKPILKKYFAYF